MSWIKSRWTPNSCTKQKQQQQQQQQDGFCQTQPQCGKKLKQNKHTPQQNQQQ